MLHRTGTRSGNGQSWVLSFGGVSQLAELSSDRDHGGRLRDHERTQDLLKLSKFIARESGRLWLGGFETFKDTTGRLDRSLPLPFLA